MTPDEKVAHLLALARSTPFTSERETAIGLARPLFNKYRLTDARLRWDLLRALGLEAGPEPARSRAASPDGTSEGEDWAAWREWIAAEQAEQERWTRAWMKRAQRRQRANPAKPQPRASAPKKGTQRRRRGTLGRAGRQSKRVRVQGYASARTVWGVPSYTREIATRPIRFTCAWYQATVTQQRFPGPLPAYCSEDCKKETQRADPGARTPLSGAPAVTGRGGRSGREEPDLSPEAVSPGREAQGVSRPHSATIPGQAAWWTQRFSLALCL